APSTNNQLVSIIYLSPVANLFLKFRFELYSVFEGEKGKTLVNMVALGMGVTLLMEQSIGENLDSKVVKVPIVPQVTQNLAFVRRKNVEHTPRQEKLWQALKESFEK
ncbi:LysR family transcriptional regulator substrate-binding protein, partial [Limosilactobacillus reuteri]